MGCPKKGAAPKQLILVQTVPIHWFRHFCCRMYHLATMQTQTDRQTDRQTAHSTMTAACLVVVVVHKQHIRSEQVYHALKLYESTCCIDDHKDFLMDTALLPHRPITDRHNTLLTYERKCTVVLWTTRASTQSSRQMVTSFYKHQSSCSATISSHAFMIAVNCNYLVKSCLSKFTYTLTYFLANPTACSTNG